MLTILITISQILTAGIVITAFSLVLYALPFNLKDKVARSYVFILICVSIIYTGEALGGTASTAWWVELWLRIQWVGIIFLPATYIHFSDSLLATTGVPTSPRRRWMVIAAYFISAVIAVMLIGNSFLGRLVTNQPPSPYLKATLLADFFIVYYVVMVLYSWTIMYRAYRRTATPTSRRRMYYLMTGSFALAAGSFPFLLFGSGFAAQYQVMFWIIAIVTNLLVGTFMVVMAYAVAFFGVAWPDRVVKSRLFKWMMRGPATASITLGLVTLVRRAGETVGESYTAMVPLVMVGSIILCEYAITLLAPYGSKVLFYGNDHKDLELIRMLEDRLITRGDLEQFIETILAAMCDRVQAGGAYLIAVSGGNAELVGRVGKLHNEKLTPDELNEAISQQDEWSEVVEWKDDQIIPLFNGSDENEPELIGFLGISYPRKKFLDLDDEELGALRMLYKRAEMALHDRLTQEKIFQSLGSLSDQADLIQRLRAAGQFDPNQALDNTNGSAQDISLPVRYALSHYWGGPKLTESPLLKLNIVQTMLAQHDGNPVNAVRAVLKDAIEKMRPEGERKYTGEWMLYNILEMKFLEGKKVKEIAMRLSMSEADLYRKQRVAIDTVAKTINEMETENDISGSSIPIDKK